MEAEAKVWGLVCDVHSVISGTCPLKFCAILHQNVQTRHTDVTTGSPPDLHLPSAVRLADTYQEQKLWSRFPVRL